MEGSRIQIQEEILLAKQSRREGNEGRARVCARRAAGAAARDFLADQGIETSNLNAIRSLIKFAEHQPLPLRVYQAVNNMLERVDENHNLPAEVDLIQEADIIICYVNGGEEG